MNYKTAFAASVSVAALMASTFAASAQDMTALYDAAKAEGQLTTIALPHDWCGYGAVIEGFKAKYPGITVNELNPDAGSGDEIEAIKANKGNTGPQAPDVIDVGLSFGPTAKADGLIQPYKVSTWDSIPDSAKDADGYWYGDYYGVLSFLVNNDLVPKVADQLGRPQEARIRRPRSPSPAIRVPPTRRSRPSMPPASRPVPRRVPMPALPASSSSPTSTPPATSCRSSARPPRSPRARPRSSSPGTTTRWHGATALPATRSPKSSFPPTRSSPASTSRPSAPTRRTPTPPSSGWNISIRTKARSAGWLAIATRSASTTWPPRTPFRQDLLAKLPPTRPSTPRPCSRPSTSRAPPRRRSPRQWDSVVGANVQ